MKNGLRKIFKAALTLVLILNLASFSYASTDVKVLVNGRLVTFPDAQPYINEDDRTLVPVRFIAENMDCEVEWNGEIRQVGIKRNDKEIKLNIGESKATVNEETITFDTKAIIKEDRTFVPLRFISEALGATVEWDGDSRTVTITTEDYFQLTNTEFWKEGIQAVKEYIKEQKENNPDEVYYSEEMFEKYQFQEKDIDNAYNMAYNFAMDMHNYSYKEDTQELRYSIAERYVTLEDGTVNPWLINIWWDFAKAEKVIKKAVFVADKDCLYKFGRFTLRGRLYFKYDSLERLTSFDNVPNTTWYKHYLGNERYIEHAKLYEVEEDNWYYKDIDVYISTLVYRDYFSDEVNQTYYCNIGNWNKNISNFKEVTKDIEKELEEYVNSK